MLRRIAVGLLLAAFVVPCNLSIADDRFSTNTLGQRAHGKVDEHNVNADLYRGAVMVFGTDSSCERDYFVAASTIIKSTTPNALSSCTMVLCQDHKLMKECPDKIKKKSEQVKCTGTSEYVSASRIRLVINHDQETWKIPGCEHLKSEPASTVIMLDLPSPPNPQGSQIGISLDDLIACATSTNIYPPGHPLHGNRCKK